jgi:hypothetical protein
VCRVPAHQLHVGLAQYVQQTHQRAGIGHGFEVALMCGVVPVMFLSSLGSPGGRFG